MKIQTMLLGAGVLALPLMVIAQDQSVSATNMSHIKQADLAVIMYTVDYDDLLPYAQSTGGVIEVTLPYTRKPDVWWPVDGRRFLFNMALGGVNSSTLTDVSGTVAIYSDRKDAQGTWEVAYTDGHARRLTEDRWAIEQKTLRKKYPRKGKPLPASLGARYNVSSPPPLAPYRLK